jgi:nitroimidazol reductase NimA-like FMN-containing flavoprotein (pyridoxamine 5'-phosphate oxidase superfamily)
MEDGMAKMQRRKTDQDHKASFSYGVHCNCSCGWSSATWFGKGAKLSAAGEWHNHRDKCEKANVQKN